MKRIALLLIIYCLVQHSQSQNQSTPVVLQPKPMSYEHGYVYGNYYGVRHTFIHTPNSVASIWPRIVRAPFAVTIWPPKYCQSVMICLIPLVEVNDASQVKIKEDWCQESLRVYPFRNEIVYFNEGTAKKTYTFNNHIIKFAHVKKGEFKVQLNEKKLKSHAEWTNSPIDGLNINMDQKSILLLTNSAQCRATITQGHSVLEYFDLPGLKNIKLDSAPYAKLIGKSYQAYRDPLVSMAVPSYKPGTGRTVDPLHMLSNFVVRQQKNKKMRCTPNDRIGHETTMAKRFRLAEVTLVKYDFNRFTGHLAEGVVATYEFNFVLSSCHWLRIAIYNKEEDFAANPTKYLIDLFFDEGFMLTPDSDEAKPLPGGSELMKQFKIVHHENSETKNNEILYGFTGATVTYRESFLLDVFKENVFFVKLIRSSMCDAEYVYANALSFDAENPDRSTEYNHFHLQKCTMDVLDPKK